MRALYLKIKRERLFNMIKNKTALSYRDLAILAGVSARSMNSWKNGHLNIPISFINKIEKDFKITLPKPDKLTNLSETRSKCGRLGGIQRQKLYGNLGTPEGRSRGGKISSKKMSMLPNSPFAQRKIKFAKKSKALAELIGIILGDGGISDRQVTITLHKKDDQLYANYVKYLFESLFKTPISLIERSDENVVQIISSRTSLVTYLIQLGLLKGNKVKNQIKVPNWIIQNKNYSMSCMRGLFDTDGCIYIDSHKKGDKIYKNMGMNFSNRSLPLLSFFFRTMQRTSLRPTQTSPFSIVLRREKDIVTYFKKIGTSNEKHKNKFLTYQETRKGTKEVIMAPIRNRMVG